MLVELPARGWLHVVAPDDADRRTLAELGLPDDFLEHVLDPYELARILHDGDEDELLLTIRVPPRDGARRHGLALGVVVQRDRLITVASQPIDLVEEVAGREELAGARPFRWLVELLLAIAQAFVARVGKIDERVEQLERALSESLQNREVLALLEQQKSLVHLERALASNQIMLDLLRKEPRCEAEDEERSLLADALVEFQQAMSMTKISTEILSGMMDAFASIINNNLNQVFRILAALTIVLAVPGVITGLWGMNVPVPGEGKAWAFAALVAGVTGLAGGVALLFRSRRWL